MTKHIPEWLTKAEQLEARAVSGPDPGTGFPAEVFVRIGPDGPVVAEDDREEAEIRKIWPAAVIRRR